MEVSDHYNQTYRNDYDVPKSDFLERVNIVLSLIGTGKKVLDIGCFNGFISKKIQEAGNEVVGVEFSAEAVKLTREKGVKCVRHNLEGKPLPFAENSFDLIFLGEVIEHVFDTDKLLAECHRVLNKEGELVLTTPNLAAFNRRIKLLLGISPSIDIGTKLEDNRLAPGHIRYFTKKTLEILLRRNGFKPVLWSGDIIILKSLRFPRLAKKFPTIAWCLIVKAHKEEDVLKNERKD